MGFSAVRKLKNFLQNPFIFLNFMKMVSRYRAIEHIREKKVSKNMRESGEIAVRKLTGGSLNASQNSS